MLRRILSLTLSTLLLFTPLAPAWGQMAGGHQLAAGTVLASAVHCSMVATNAFCFIDGIDLSRFIGAKISLRDSSGRVAVGYVMAASGGEALSADDVAGWDFTSGWTPQIATVTDANTFDVTTVGGRIIKIPSILVQGGLFKATYAATASAGQTSLGDASGQGAVHHIIGTPGGTTGYFTSAVSSANLYLYGSAISTIDVTTLTFQRVTDGPVTGIKIASAKGSAVQSWAAITTGFDPNNVTYYRLERTHAAVVVASSSPAAGVVKMATVADGALLEVTGTDISPQASTANYSHLVVLYSGTAGAALAYTGAVGGGLTLAADLLIGEGAFAAAGNWVTDAGWAVGGGVLTGTATTGNTINTVRAPTNGALYYAAYDLAVTSGTVRILVGSATLGTQTTTGSKTGYVTCNASTAIVIDGVAAYTGTVDNLSVQRVTDVPVTALSLRNAPQLGGAQSLIGTVGTFNPNLVTAEKRYLVGP